MKIEISEGKLIILKEIFCDTVLETAEGNRLSICMRDDTVEMSVPGTNKWFRVDMETGDIQPFSGIPQKKLISTKTRNDILNCLNCGNLFSANEMYSVDACSEDCQLKILYRQAAKLQSKVNELVKMLAGWRDAIGGRVQMRTFNADDRRFLMAISEETSEIVAKHGL